MSDPTIVVAGASGNLGERIVKGLRERGANVRAIVRRETAKEKVERLQALGAAITVVDMGNLAEVTEACSGASCVVSCIARLAGRRRGNANDPAGRGDRGGGAALHSI